MVKTNNKKGILILVLKWLLGVVVALLIFMFAIPQIFNDYISQEIKKGINENLRSELQFKASEISFFRHFPSLTFSFEEVNLAEPEPFSKERIITAKELGFGINIFKLIFSNELKVEETYLTDCDIRLVKDKFGRNNYDNIFYVDSISSQDDSSSLGLNLNLDKLKIKNANVLYKDEENGITIKSNGFNYKGKGGLDKGILELGSQLDIDSIDVIFDKVEYLKGKTLKAKSFTIYDTKTLSIELDDNTISLNDLNVNFNGRLDVFDDGLSYNVVFNTKNGTLQNVVSALPPKYTEWSKSMDMNGDIDATCNLIGYSGTVPDSLKREHVSLDLVINNGEIAHKTANQKLENIQVKFKGSLENGLMDFRLDNLNFKLQDELTAGKLVLKGREDSLYVKSNIQSKVDLTMLNETLQLPDFKFNGILWSNWNMEGVYQPLASKFPKTEGSFKLTNGFVQTSGHPEPIKNINIDALVQNNGNSYSDSSLKINALNFSFLENKFAAKAFFQNFDQPEYEINSVGSIDFTSLHQVVDLPFLISKGALKVDLNLKGQLSNPDDENSTSVTPNSHSGTLDIVESIQIETDVLPQPLLVKGGKFLFLDDKMAFSNLNIQHESTQVSMNGFFQDYLNYALFSNGILRGDVKLESSKIVVTEFFPKKDQLTSQAVEELDSEAAVVEEVISGVMQVPKDMDITFQIQVDTLKYNLLNINELSGVLGIKDQGLYLKSSDLKMVDGNAQIEGFYHPLNLNEAIFSMDIEAKNLNIKKGYETIQLFKELVPAAEKASGNVSISYNMSGSLDNQMLPLMPSLKGKGTLKAQDLQFEGYKLLGTISKESGFGKLNDPSVKEIAINSTIENNILKMERFRFKVSPFRIRTEGETSLDGMLNLKMRIGLPPLGVIGIPIVINGTSEDFNIKLGSKSPDLDEFKNTGDSYSEEELQRVSMLKDSIREGMTIDEIDEMQRKIEKINLDSLRVKAVDTLKIQQ
ncbi:AsmA protein [Winogradskyella pacifica]|uniref:AsmA protein n=1 Tax=Winogradskyella pacifica TaxID=664642 RepID=A0A3D9N5V9_9FLAO|nr:AsmA-like C-terminal region-containing protein [Winogradskyella pacifica]REE27513.1 AsmA protein [Winogradskyella pacifica]